ncbi:hypothetical protein SAMN05421787_101426 [Virgibacillus pantothenticus]|nr:hypothetical protein SAMN05421787_101426 [Virgibacillus pantothenticus]
MQFHGKIGRKGPLFLRGLLYSCEKIGIIKLGLHDIMMIQVS